MKNTYVIMGNGIASILSFDCNESCNDQKLLELRLGQMQAGIGQPYLGSSTNSSPYHLNTVTASKTIDDSFESEYINEESTILNDSVDDDRSSWIYGHSDKETKYANCVTPSSKVNNSKAPGLVASPNEGDDDSLNDDESCSTLPSFVEGKPIHLRITEESYSLTENVSFDPYIRCGQFAISQFNDEKKQLMSYGDGLFMKVSPQFMTLQDKHDKVYAACRSRYTFIPSYIIYAPKPRYYGQIKSTFSLSRSSSIPGLDLVKLYPWALVKKENGRRLETMVTIHMIDEDLQDGSFKSDPLFQSAHQFTGGVHTHTIVSRVDANSGENLKLSNNACCLSIRESINQIDQEAYDVTISPGIDPLLMVCYITIHSKMDIEPQLNLD